MIKISFKGIFYRFEENKNGNNNFHEEIFHLFIVENFSQSPITISHDNFGSHSKRRINLITHSQMRFKLVPIREVRIC